MRKRKRLSDLSVMRRAVLREVGEERRKREEEEVADEKELTCQDSREASLEHRSL